MLTTPQVANLRRMFRVSSTQNLRRVFCLTSLAAALAVVVSIAGGARSVDQAHAATGSCVKHTKRVVKHVERHGKRTRVVHLKPYWTCEEAPTASPAPAPTPAPAPSPPAPTPVPTPNPITEAPKIEQLPEPEANAVSVTATDEPGNFTYTPSRTVVHSGRLLVEFNNQGMDAHDMFMQRVGPNEEPEEEVIKVSEVTKSTQHTVKTYEDVQPGRYRMWCSFGTHAKEGMETHIEVKAAE